MQYIDPYTNIDPQLSVFYLPRYPELLFELFSWLINSLENTPLTFLRNSSKTTMMSLGSHQLLTRSLYIRGCTVTFLVTSHGQFSAVGSRGWGTEIGRTAGKSQADYDVKETCAVTIALR